MTSQWFENYKSDFAKKDDRFKVIKDQFSSIFPQDGYYHFVIFGPNQCRWQTFDFAPDDFKVTVDVQGLANAKNDSKFGIIFRADSSGGYRYLITQTGYYALFAVNMHGNWTTILPWRYSGYLRQGEGANNLGVIAVKDSITLFANGYEVISIFDDKFQQGNLGFHVCSGNTDSSAGAKFRNFVLHTQSPDLLNIGGTCVHWDHKTQTICGKPGRYRAYGRGKGDERGPYNGLWQFCENHVPRCEICNSVIRNSIGCDCEEATGRRELLEIGNRSLQEGLDAYYSMFPDDQSADDWWDDR